MTPPVFKSLGLQPYQQTWQAMQAFTEERDEHTEDEIWWVEHPPVFTQGRNGKAEHLLDPGDIPVIAVDRGGQVTYHGPGQIVFYCLIDLRRRKLGVRQLVTLIEQSIIELLDSFGVSAAARSDAPGVYVQGEKIAALGLRIRRGCSFHGLSLNVDMDLSPFECINPCGYADLKVTQTREQGITANPKQLAQSLYGLLADRLG